MILTIKQQIKSCKRFLRYWKIIKPANVTPGLGNWNLTPGVPHSCNTIACAAGSHPAMPEFKKIGVRYRLSDGAPYIDSGVGYPFARIGPLTEINGSDVEFTLFGNRDLFISRLTDSIKCKDYDHNIGDHDRVTRRFQDQIKILEANLP